MEQSKLQVEILAKFSKDIGMEFREDKFGYIYIERGKRKTQGKAIIMNGVTIKELEEGESYRYLGQNESIGYEGSLNKERVEKEYYRRVRQIWTSELNVSNKVIANNSFALPVLTPTIRILDWSIAEMELVDKKTRRILCITGNFHRNSDVNRLYLKRAKGGRGLKSFEQICISRFVSLKRHIAQDRDKNYYLENVYEHEKERIVRLGEEHEKMYLKESTEQENARQTSKTVSDKIKQKLEAENKEKWVKKPQHGYLQAKINNDDSIDHKASNLWIKKGKFSSRVEGFLFAIQEQEIDTRGLRKMREKNKELRATMPATCRLCGRNEETIFHIISSCTYLSRSLYLHSRHNPVAKTICDEFIADLSGTEDSNVERYRQPAQVTKMKHIELWWDYQFTTLTKLPHNRPDIVIWNSDTEVCKIIDICVPLDTNVYLREEAKSDSYIPLVDQLQRIYQRYKFTIVPVITGVLGTVPNKLEENLQKIVLSENRIRAVIQRIQKDALLGTLKIVKKTFRNFEHYGK